MINFIRNTILAALPAVPSTTPVYMTTLTTTTDEDTTTWTDVDIGIPHPKRVVCLIGYRGVSVATIAGDWTVNNIIPVSSTRSGHWGGAVVEVPVGSTATIGHTAVASVRKAISVYVLYPEWSRALQTIGTTATTTTDAAVTIASASCNGCIIYAGGQDATLGTFTTTWGGTDAVIEDIDAQLEGTASYTSGHVNLTESSFTNALTLAESTSGTKALVAISLRPPYRGR